MHTVVLDDNPHVLKSIQIALDAISISHTAFASVDPFLEFVSTESFDLLILDYRLESQRSGLDVLTQVRASNDNAVPTILITGFASAELLEQIRELPAVTLLEKPFSIAALESTIRELMNH